MDLPEIPERRCDELIHLATAKLKERVRGLGFGDLGFRGVGGRV